MEQKWKEKVENYLLSLTLATIMFSDKPAQFSIFLASQIKEEKRKGFCSEKV